MRSIPVDFQVLLELFKEEDKLKNELEEVEKRGKEIRKRLAEVTAAIPNNREVGDVMPKYWLAKNYGAYEGWKLEGPFNNLTDCQEEFEKMLEEGNGTPIKLFKELRLEVKEDA